MGGARVKIFDKDPNSKQTNGCKITNKQNTQDKTRPTSPCRIRMRVSPGDMTMSRSLSGCVCDLCSKLTLGRIIENNCADQKETKRSDLLSEH